jgi:aminoglycoside phosphotransferase family enzyme/predicted kinase
MHRQTPSEAVPYDNSLVTELSSMLQAEGEVTEVVETHISWVVLTEKLAYKIKKPIKNDFLDYATLDQRRWCCEEELRLDQRFAPDLYLDVVPLTRDSRGLQIAGAGPACEYAVRMRRFASQDVLHQRLRAGHVTRAQVREFAYYLADFHQSAEQASAESEFGQAEQVARDALDNIAALQGVVEATVLQRLEQWTQLQFEALRSDIEQRRKAGWIRECHGDLHSGNIVWWHARFVPFDGIEFNPHFRWIDVVSDAAFLAMDLWALGHRQLAAIFVSSYLERSGDYNALRLLRWYMVYRALVRAKVAALSMQQQTPHSDAYVAAADDLYQHTQLAVQLAQPATEVKILWITHGLSGSGKSTVAEQIVADHGAIRLRSDIERKRLWGHTGEFRPTAPETEQLYAADMSHKTYQQLQSLCQTIVAAGFGVVVDATFLKYAQRHSFQLLAEQLRIPFRIVDCRQELQELKRRLAERHASGLDPSDATVQVLEQQLLHQEPLRPSEQPFIFPVAVERTEVST